jgi:hypothetical protein
MQRAVDFLAASAGYAGQHDNPSFTDMRFAFTGIFSA